MSTAESERVCVAVTSTSEKSVAGAAAAVTRDVMEEARAESRRTERLAAFVSAKGIGVSGTWLANTPVDARVPFVPEAALFAEALALYTTDRDALRVENAARDARLFWNLLYCEPGHLDKPNDWATVLKHALPAGTDLAFLSKRAPRGKRQRL